MRRRELEFIVKLRSGSVQWMTHVQLSGSEMYQNFCNKSSYLRILTLPATSNTTTAARYRKAVIPVPQPNSYFWLDLRAFGAAAYSNLLTLTDRYTHMYVVKAIYDRYDNDNHTRIRVNVEHFPEANFVADAWFLHLHTGNSDKVPTGATRVTHPFKSKNRLKLSVPEKE